MTLLENKFNFYKNTIGDINEHLETLKKYSQECDYIVEMGVRTMISTWAFLSGRPKKLTSIDILRPDEYTHNSEGPNNFKDVFLIAKNENIEFEFIKADTLKIEIEECDLLFIDTLHIYDQLKNELLLHGNRSKKYIVMHDTECCGYENNGNLWKAIDEFLNENSHWKKHEIFTNNNGLTILKRYF